MEQVNTRTRQRGAFTLVALLVVVGIIAVLVALLMPALSAARDAANRAKCLANLRSMAQAAYMHAQEHKGYLPVAGHQSPLHLGVDATSDGLRDPGRQKYMYFRQSASWRPMPLPASLGQYMGLEGTVRQADRRVTDLEEALAGDNVRRMFACPGQDLGSVRGGYTTSDGGWNGPTVYMGYIFNGSVLARTIYPWAETPAGKLSSVRWPTRVFLFADGNSGRTAGGVGMYSVHADFSAETTLFGYWQRGGRQSGQFDHTRHRNRMNVVFVDGHAETLMLPDPRRPNTDGTNAGDLDQVGLSKGIFN